VKPAPIRRIALVGVLGLVLGLAVPASAAAAALFGLVDTGELYRSTNGGATWTIQATLTVGDAVGLAASSSASVLTIVTRSGTVYRSTDAGTSWSAIGAITAADIAAFTILADGKLLALTQSGTLYRSVDGGLTFTGYGVLTASNFVSLIRGPLDRIYALTRTGEVYESQTSGASWTPVGSVAVSNAVSLGRKVSELYILTESGEIYRSLNYGVTWLAVGAITANNMSAIAASGSSIVACARSGEIYESSSGASWTAVGAVNQLQVMSLGSDEPLATGVEIEEGSPKLVIGVPYPNPARGAGTFPFALGVPGTVRLELYDVQGRLVASVAETSFGSGPHALAWAPKGLAAGRYLVRYLFDGRRMASASWAVVR